MEYVTPFGTVNLPINSNAGISCSGGADSTIVLYMMVLNGMLPRIFFLTKANSNYPALVSCVDFINKKFGTSLEIEVQDRVETGHYIGKEVASFAKKVDFLYTGVTQNPPVDIGQGPNRPPRGTTHPKLIMPFIELDKRVSIYLYEMFGVRELLEMTYTCTETKEIPCNMCFACKERNWGIEEVSLFSSVVAAPS